MNSLPNETLYQIFNYLDGDMIKIQVLNKRFHAIFNHDKFKITYKILKKYNSGIIFGDAYAIFKYAVKHKIYRFFNKYVSISDRKRILSYASENGHLEVFRYYSLSKRDGLQSLFGLASYNGHLDVVKYFIENGVNVNRRCSILNSSINDLALSLASSNGHLEVVKYLIERISCAKTGISRSNEMSALRCASQNGHIEIVKYIIEKLTSQPLF